MHATAGVALGLAGGTLDCERPATQRLLSVFGRSVADFTVRSRVAGALPPEWACRGLAPRVHNR